MAEAAPASRVTEAEASGSVQEEAVAAAVLAAAAWMAAAAVLGLAVERDGEAAEAEAPACAAG